MAIVIGTGGITTLTANDIIRKALMIGGVIEESAEMTSSDQTEGLISLNALLDTLWNDRLAVYQILEETFTWTANQSSRTIGTGGNFSATRPLQISDGFSRISNIDYPYRVVPKEVYDGIPDKTTTADYMEMVYYAPTMSTGTLYAWPVPDANLSFHLNSWKQIQTFTSGTAQLSLPPGYASMLFYNLAEWMESENGLPVSETAKRIAHQTKTAIKRHNAPNVQATTDVAYALGRNYSGNTIFEA